MQRTRQAALHDFVLCVAQWTPVDWSVHFPFYHIHNYLVH